METCKSRTAIDLLRGQAFGKGLVFTRGVGDLVGLLSVFGKHSVEIPSYSET